MEYCAISCPFVAGIPNRQRLGHQPIPIFSIEVGVQELHHSLGIGCERSRKVGECFGLLEKAAEPLPELKYVGLRR